MIKVFFILFILLHSTVSLLHAEEIFLDEQFSSLERWEPFYFPKTENHSPYSTEVIDETSCLIATSNNSSWADKKQSKQFIPNAYSSLSIMFPIATGQGKVGNWLEHTQQILFRIIKQLLAKIIHP